MSILINKRCLNNRPTGVQRYVRNMLQYLPSDVESISPKTSSSAGIKGHLWEQWVLPRVLAGRMLWSPANTGPISVKNQVVTVLDLSFFEHPEWFTRRIKHWYQLMSRQLVKNARHILTISNYCADSLMRILDVPAPKISVTYCGPSWVDTKKSAAVARAVLPNELRHNRFCLAVSSIAPHKNQQRLLQAWALSVDKLPEDIWLYIVGNHTDVHRKYQLGKLPKRVKIFKLIDDTSLQKLYARAFAFVHPSLFEGFGITVLDALAQGIPTVVSDTTALPEVVGNSAILVNPYSIKAIANGIERVCLDKALREELKIKGIKRAQKFSWQDSALKTWEILNEHASAT